MAYARANEQYQKALYRQLRVLEKTKVVNKIWYDGEIIAGQQWDVEIKKNLAASQIILFLISADFMASDYIMEEEYPKSLQRQADGKATIIPIIVDHCYWEVIPDIHQLQIPNPNEPLSDTSNASLLLKKIVKAVHQAVELTTKKEKEASKKEEIIQIPQTKIIAPPILKKETKTLSFEPETVDNQGMDTLKIPDTPDQNVHQLISKNKLNIFISYSKHDKKYLEDLRISLRPFERKDQIQVWYDGEIEAGAEWDADIKNNLEAADIIILFVSRDFIKTDYIWDVEIKKAMERHKAGEAVVIPIIIRPCLWTGDATPFHTLNALPTKGKPISKWENIDDAWVNVEAGLKKVIKGRLG